MNRIAVAALILLGTFVPAGAAEFTLPPATPQPESLTVAPDGSVLMGSGNAPFVWRVRPGATTPETFIDDSAGAPGSFFSGVLSDPVSNTLWACQSVNVTGGRHAGVSAFDLTTGKNKLRWFMPSELNFCNDIALGPDKALYITDTRNAKLYRLAPGAAAAELYLENSQFNGIDGVTFLDGILYVTNVTFGKIYRVPVDAAGKPGAPVDIWVDAPFAGPDGLRAENGHMYVTESRPGRVDELVIKGDTAHVVVLKDGLKQPSAVQPAGDVIWFNQRALGSAMSIPAPK